MNNIAIQVTWLVAVRFSQWYWICVLEGLVFEWPQQQQNQHTTTGFPTLSSMKSWRVGDWTTPTEISRILPVKSLNNNGTGRWWTFLLSWHVLKNSMSELPGIIPPPNEENVKPESPWEFPSRNVSSSEGNSPSLILFQVHSPLNFTSVNSLWTIHIVITSLTPTSYSRRVR